MTESHNPNAIPASPRDTLLLKGIPTYESLRPEIGSMEIVEVTHRFGQLIATHTPETYDIAGGELDEAELAALGVALPGFSGKHSVLISNRAGDTAQQSISILHKSQKTGYWTEKFEYYLDEAGEVRRKDFRADLEEDDDDDDGITPTWQERNANASFGQSFGINNMHASLQEIATLEKIVPLAAKHRLKQDDEPNQYGLELDAILSKIDFQK